MTTSHDQSEPESEHRMQGTLPLEKDNCRHWHHSMFLILSVATKFKWPCTFGITSTEFGLVRDDCSCTIV